MKHIFIPTILLISLLVGGFFLNRQSKDLRTSKIHADLIKIADSSIDYQPTFTTINMLRSQWGEKPKFCVNQNFQTNCINVLIIDLSKISQIKTEKELILLKDLQNNAIAFPPNLILIDKRRIAYEVFETYNLMMAFIRAINRNATTVDLTTEFALASIATNSIIRTQRIPPLFFESNDSIEQFSTNLLKSNSLQHNEEINTVIGLALTLLLEHEVAHLKAGKGIFGHNPLINQVSQFKSELTLTEEKRADAVALVAMKHYIETLKNSKNATISRFYSDQFTSALPFLVEAEYMRDKALFDGLEDFRGFKADDLSIEISHQECNYKDAHSLEFFDPDNIRVARRKPLPILTKNEWVEQSKKFAKIDSPQTHLHDLLRAENIYKSLDQLSNDSFSQLSLSNHISFIQAMLSNNPKAAFPSSKGFKIIPNTSIDSLIESTQSFVNYTPAVTCPLSRCYVGMIEDSDGYIELIGSNKEIAELRLVMNMGIGLGKNKVSDEKYIQNMMRYTEVMMAAAATKSSNILDFASDLRRGLFKCRAASTLLVDENTGIAYHSTTLQKPSFLQVRIFNAEIMNE